jgi:hypothetical protein
MTTENVETAPRVESTSNLPPMTTGRAEKAGKLSCHPSRTVLHAVTPSQVSMRSFLLAMVQSTSLHGQTGFASWPNEVTSMHKEKCWRHYNLVLASIHNKLGVNTDKY